MTWQKEKLRFKKQGDALSRRPSLILFALGVTARSHDPNGNTSAFRNSVLRRRGGAGRENGARPSRGSAWYSVPDCLSRVCFGLRRSSSHTLLGLIVDAEADLWDITSFHTPSECVEATESYRSAGMSDRLVAFASDSGGNVFCFAERDLLDARPDDASVWFFDHDVNEEKQLSESFDAWLASYFSLP